MFRKKSAVQKKQVYTEEQLRYMVAPPVVDPVARSFGGPNPHTNHLAQRFLAMEGQLTPVENMKLSTPRSVPIMGSIGDSARSRAQIKAFREQQKER